jgi:hypothetical protein
LRTTTTNAESFPVTHFAWIGEIVSGESRRFALADAMILIAAATVGMTFARWEYASFLAMTRRTDLAMRSTALRETLVACSFWILLWLSLAQIPLGLRAADRPFRRLWQTPGMIAAAIITLVLTLATFEALKALSVSPSPGSLASVTYYSLEMLSAPRMYGLPLVASWATLALSGSWRPEATWRDRLGRILGWLWITAWAVLKVLAWLGYWAYQ